LFDDGEKIGYNWDLVAGQNDDCQSSARKGLLMAKLLVGRDKDVELILGSPEQLAIRQAGLAPLLDRADC